MAVSLTSDWLGSRGYDRMAQQLTDWLDGSLTDQQRADLFVAELVRGARDYVAGKRSGVMDIGGTRLSGVSDDGMAAASVDVALQLRELAASAKAGGNDNKTVVLQQVTPQEADILRSEGVNVTDTFAHSVDMFAVRHALNRHSDPKIEKNRGQIAITDDDVARINEVVSAPTAYVLGGKTPRNQDVVGTIKRLDDGTILYLEEVRSGRKTLAMTSMRKYPGTTDFDTIANSVLPSNARSDAGDVRIVYLDESQSQGRTNSGSRLSRSQPKKTIAERVGEAKALMKAEAPKAPSMSQAARGAATKAALAVTDDAARAEVMQDVVYKLQDRLIDLKWLQGEILATGGTVNELNNAYLGEELYHGRAATAHEEFLSLELKPLLEQMHREGIGMEQLEAYLHARHAPEANAELAKRNLNDQQLQEMRDKLGKQVRDLELAAQRAKAAGTHTSMIERSLAAARMELDEWRGAQAFTGTEEERMSLSGMSNEEAQAIIDAVPQGKRSAYEALAKKVDAINAQTREASVRYGLVTRQQADEWERLYQHYVPLHRDEAHPQSRLRMGQGFSVKGKESQARTGSQERVTNILAHIAAQRELTITRGEKNRVAKKLWLLAAQNPVPGFWSLEPPKKSHVDNETGLVVRGADPTYKNKPNVLTVKIAGEEHAIVFDERNERAMRLVGELKNLDAPTLDGVAKTAAEMTRWFAAVNTQYNPVFGVINFTRDVQAAGLQLSTTKLNGHQREVMQATLPALRAVWRAERGGKATNAQQEALMQQWKELQQAGGMTGYRDVFSQIEDRAKALDSMLAENDRGRAAKVAAAGLDLLTDYNQAMEGATRLAAYQQARKLGLSVNESASIAKNLTVNFNRKGALARSAAPWYAFFNAAMQGNARLIETLRGPMGKKIVAGGVLLGMATSMVSMVLMGGDDGDDQDKQTPWQKIPDFVKERSMILGWGEHFIAVPMPLGYNMFTNAGRVLAEQLMVQGKPGQGVAAAAFDALTMVVGAFNPVGGSDVVSAVTPTPVDWAIDLLRNKDWTGKSIYREDTNGLDPTPGHTRAKDSATPWAKALSRGVNWMTGGTEYTPGKWSPTPDQIDYVIGQLTGGVGREVGKLATTLASPFSADELPANKIPLISRVYGNTKSPQAGSELFYENVKRANELENEIAGRSKAGESLDGIPESAFSIVSDGNAFEAQVRALRKLRRHLVAQAADGYKEQVKEVESRMGAAMDEFNRRVNSARRLEMQQ